MSDTPELDAARNLLATLEAGRAALLGLASTHLPFARALAVHRSVAEGGADLAAAEEGITLRAELYWNAWRGAIRGVTDGGPLVEIEDDQPTAAPRHRDLPPPLKPQREVIRVDPPKAAIPRPPKAEPEPAPPPREPKSLFKERPRPAERAPEPVVEPVAERAPEPVVEPVAERAPEPVVEPAPRAGPVAPAPEPARPHRPPAPAGAEPQVLEEQAIEEGPSPHVRVIDPVTESPLLEELAREMAEADVDAAAASVSIPRDSGGLPDVGKLPFEPISELDYVDDDPSEVTQVGQNEAPPLLPVGTIVPGLGGGQAPARPKPDLIVDDFNEISELEELEPGEFGSPADKGHLTFDRPPSGRAEVQALPIAARRAEDEEVLAQGDAPILPEFATHQDDLSLSFEMGTGILKAAPRLTDESEAAPPTPAPPPRRDAAADQALFQKALADADAAINRGDLARAIQFYSDALDLVPGNAEAHIGRGRCSLELGDYSSAMSDFQRAEDLSPNDPESHLAMGDLYYNRKEYKRAIDFYDEAVELDGQHAMAKCKRGLAHYYRKNYRQAFQDLQRSMALDPNIPNIHKYVQMALKKMDAKS